MRRIDALLARVPGWLGSKVNIGVGLALLVLLVLAPLVGIPVSDHVELLGGNWTNCVGYVAASIAAGASAVNLHEGRKHRTRVETHLAHHARRLDALHDHVTKPSPRAGRVQKESAP